MRIYGIDFTSAPSRRKPLTCAVAELHGSHLVVDEVVRWTSFAGFEALLEASGPWVAAMDFPFGQARRLIENIGWPRCWAGYVGQVRSMSKGNFKSALTDYKANRTPGDKQHRRTCDVLARSQSPQTLYFTPVGLMFYEGAPRLLNAGVHLPHLHDGDPSRIVVEGYPGLAARSLIGPVSYKSDDPARQTAAQHGARRNLLSQLLAGRCEEAYGLSLRAPLRVADDPSGDELDAVLCAVQGAWASRHQGQRFGAPPGYDRLEGWICDPALVSRR